SPFEEPAVDDGYGADAFSIEQPAGMHLTATPREAEMPEPFPPPPLPSEDEDEDVDASGPGVAPGFIQGDFGANVPPPPPAADDFAKTITMADLYANQGLIDEARDIYEDVLARDPGNETVRRKLEALEQAAGFGAEASEQSVDTQALGEPELDVEPEPAAEPEARGPRPAARQKKQKLESWLSKVKRPGVGSV
ncbi:MAG TPA: tetratricopeptide repeat protein, partial [Thermoanaerobaculia bacterium]|nr:tetratricopeptide repeat protein [Thermoanaerobaculia bacterium]